MPPPAAARQFDKTLPVVSRPAPLAVARPLLPTAEAILPYLQRIDTARWYSNFGPLLNEFEGRLGQRFAPGTHIVTVANGTQALALTLAALRLKPGLVAMPSWTFVATAHAVMQAGLTPWLVDVDPETGMLDPCALHDQLAAAPGPVRAVVPVAPHGQMPDLGAWKAFRGDTRLPVIIDGAAAFDAATDAALPIMVSLHATKALGLGEGGFVATEEPALADRLRGLTTFAFRGSRQSRFPATNSKLSEYTAAVGLAALDAWPTSRLRYSLVAQRLRMALAMTPQVQFQAGWGMSWVSSVCVVTLPDGAAGYVEAALKAEGVDTRRWWDLGCHTNPAFANLPRTRLPHTEALARSTLGLPFSIDMTDDEIARLAAALRVAVG